jgi:hypothetical protein
MGGWRVRHEGVPSEHPPWSWGCWVATRICRSSPTWEPPLPGWLLPELVDGGVEGAGLGGPSC